MLTSMRCENHSAAILPEEPFLAKYSSKHSLFGDFIEPTEYIVKYRNRFPRVDGTGDGLRSHVSLAFG